MHHQIICLSIYANLHIFFFCFFFKLRHLNFSFLILRISLNELEPRLRYYLAPVCGDWNALPPLTPESKVFFLLFLLSAHLSLFHYPFLLFILFFLYIINILFLSFLYYASLWAPLSISCSLFMSLFSYLSLCFHILSLSIHPSVYLITFLSFCLLPAILSHSFGCPSVELFCFILCLFPHWCRTGGQLLWLAGQLTSSDKP